MLSVSVSGYDVLKDKKNETCDAKNRISKHTDYTIQQCKDLCDSQTTCKFFFVNADYICSSYTSCNDRLGSFLPGSTFQKGGN